MDPKNSKKLVDKKIENYWAPVDLYVGGAEHATRHLIYARFWHKFLYDIGAVSTKEPFKKLQHVGLIMAEDGRKMSKRWGNVVNPDEIVKTYGADTLRVYEMFMGPFDQAIAWNTNSMVGSRRFIEKVWKFYNGGKVNLKSKSLEIPVILHKTIKKVTEDIADMRYNTSISSMMIALNELETATEINKDTAENFIKLFAPFAPHIADEIWTSILKNKKSIHLSDWPKFDEAKIGESKITLSVQVNGKVRDTIELDKNTPESAVKDMVLKLPNTSKWLEGKEIKKFIYIPGRVISIVTN
jgi:leucyl-tRNA synthetase